MQTVPKTADRTTANMGPDLEKTTGKKLLESNNVHTCMKMQSNPLVLNAKANTTLIILASFAC